MGENGTNRSLAFADFLRDLRAGNYWSDQNHVHLELIVGAVTLKTTPGEIRMGHSDGRGAHNKQVIVPPKKEVNKRQESQRLLEVK